MKKFFIILLSTIILLSFLFMLFNWLSKSKDIKLSHENKITSKSTFDLKLDGNNISTETKDSCIDSSLNLLKSLYKIRVGFSFGDNSSPQFYFNTDSKKCFIKMPMTFSGCRTTDSFIDVNSGQVTFTSCSNFIPGLKMHEKDYMSYYDNSGEEIKEISVDDFNEYKNLMEKNHIYLEQGIKGSISPGPHGYSQEDKVEFNQWNELQVWVNNPDRKDGSSVGVAQVDDNGNYFIRLPVGVYNFYLSSRVGGPDYCDSKNGEYCTINVEKDKFSIHNFNLNKD